MKVFALFVVWVLPSFFLVFDFFGKFAVLLSLVAASASRYLSARI